jgi:hypothetical protein
MYLWDQCSKLPIEAMNLLPKGNVVSKSRIKEELVYFKDSLAESKGVDSLPSFKKIASSVSASN